jgi:hypothetical protein
MPNKLLTCPEEITVMADMYFAECEAQSPRRPITMPGLAYALGFTSAKSLGKYRSAEGYEEFHDAMNRACLRVEQFTAESLYGKNSNVAGPIFALKNMGWKDKEPEKQGDTIINIIGEAKGL